MQDTFHSKLLNESQVCFTDGIRNEDESLVVNLCTDVVAHPIFVVEVKDCRIDRLNQGGTPRLNSLEEVSKYGGVLLLPVFFTVSLAGDKRVLEGFVVVIDQVYRPFGARPRNSESDVLYFGYVDVFNHVVLRSWRVDVEREDLKEDPIQ